MECFIYSPTETGKVREEPALPENQTRHYPYGYRPPGVGSPERVFRPVDNGQEWDEEAIADWLRRLTPDGRSVVGVLAKGGTIDPRAEARKLRWPGTRWAGVWTGPRRQAGHVKELRGLRSWPYGHTYAEPRRLWTHPDTAKRVLNVLQDVAAG